MTDGLLVVLVLAVLWLAVLSTALAWLTGRLREEIRILRLQIEGWRVAAKALQSLARRNPPAPPDIDVPIERAPLAVHVSEEPKGGT